MKLDFDICDLSIDNTEECEGIIIKEYQLYEKREEGLSLFSTHSPIIYHPYIRFYIEKETYDKFLGEKVDMRPKLDVILEQITKNFASERDRVIEIIGYDIHKDLSGDDISENGYYATVTFQSGHIPRIAME